jgi:nucleoside-triphosphatase
LTSEEAQGKEGSSSFNKGIAVGKVLLLTGKPGTGKTAIIKETLARTKIKGGGFYTEEIRVGGIRQGFKIVTLSGQEAILAHVSISSPYQVSKYKVDIDSLDEIGVSAIKQALEESDLIVIDEIGKMELLSPPFREVVWQVINSGNKVLGTITLSPHPFANEIKRHPEIKTLLVTRTNHDQMLEEILNWLGVTAR